MIGPSVLVTGATGFVGKAVVLRLLHDKVFAPVAAVRDASRLGAVCRTVSFDMDDASVQPCLEGVNVVVHCAARVHVMKEVAEDALAAFRKVNVDGTVRLARHAAASGVARFVFVSSIKVNGEATQPGAPFMADDIANPVDAYGISKREAEDALWKISRETGMEVVIIRPPLVYGPDVKANFQSMMRWLARGLPLPLGALNNRRSLVAIGNLVDLINVCITHPRAPGNVFLVSDGEDLSTSQLLRRMAIAQGSTARLLPVPSWLLEWGASLVGRRDVAQRLCGSLQVDINKTRSILGWQPPVGVNEALRLTALGVDARSRR